MFVRQEAAASRVREQFTRLTTPKKESHPISPLRSRPGTGMYSFPYNSLIFWIGSFSTCSDIHNICYLYWWSFTELSILVIICCRGKTAVAIPNVSATFDHSPWSATTNWRSVIIDVETNAQDAIYWTLASWYGTRRSETDSATLCKVLYHSVLAWLIVLRFHIADSHLQGTVW